MLIVYKQNNSTKYAGFDDEGRYLGDGNKYVGSTNNLGDARDDLIVTTMKVEYEQYTKGMDQVMYTTDEYEPVVEEKEMEKYDQCVVPVSIEKIKWWNWNLLFHALETMEKASVVELKQVLLGTLPAVLNDKQQSKKVSNILQSMKREKIVDVEGTRHAARWYLKK